MDGMLFLKGTNPAGSYLGPRTTGSQDGPGTISSPAEVDAYFLMDWFCWENLNRKPCFLPSNIGLSCKLSHHPVVWHLDSKPYHTMILILLICTTREDYGFFYGWVPRGKPTLKRHVYSLGIPCSTCHLDHQLVCDLYGDILHWKMWWNPSLCIYHIASNKKADTQVALSNHSNQQLF